MYFSTFFRNVFGIPDSKPPEYTLDSNDDTVPNGNDFRNPIWNLDDDDDDDDFRNNPRSNFSFQIFTNPLEMHRFFEHQMGQILKSFQNEMGLLPPNFGGDNGFPAIRPPGEIPNSDNGAQGSLRDKFLKPGSKIIPEQPSPLFFKDKKTDTDLDERIKSGGIDGVFKEEPIEPPAELSPGWGFQSKVFGRSMIAKTVRRPDGTIEHHKTTRDSQGNEETTITRQVGDQSYSVTTKLNPSGVEERIENFVNIDEGHLSEFEKKWSSGFETDPTPPERDSVPHNWFPFDKFFSLH